MTKYIETTTDVEVTLDSFKENDIIEYLEELGYLIIDPECTPGYLMEHQSVVSQLKRLVPSDLKRALSEFLFDSRMHSSEDILQRLKEVLG